MSDVESAQLPLAGLRVVEFSHVVMGPACGLVLADLGADVVKVEPPVGGDKTRNLGAASAGLFTMYSRNKRSVAADVRTPEGLAFIRRLIAHADVLIENFRPGALDAVGLDYASLSEKAPRLVYCSLKGFLAGPYERRVALDEVVQMMGGLAYMTGPPGQPLRVGASINDVMGAVFAVAGIVAALYERERTGRGKLIKAGLFENNAFLVGQHMARFAVTGQAPRPMPVRDSGWGIYDVFETSDEERVFVAVVTDTQWRTFCEAFDLAELGAMETLATNQLRVESREWLLPRLAGVLVRHTRAEICNLCEGAGVGFAPIQRPDELFDDPHLSRPEARVDITLDDGTLTWLPGLPLELDNRRPRGGLGPPRLGEHTVEVAEELGYTSPEISRLVDAGVLAVPGGVRLWGCSVAAPALPGGRSRIAVGAFGPGVDVLGASGGCIAEGEVDRAGVGEELEVAAGDALAEVGACGEFGR
jgi:crotonobetainyl-CoA:carnitine CoA-transferase CaiB-like acyl-CoA transferase